MNRLRFIFSSFSVCVFAPAHQAGAARIAAFGHRNQGLLSDVSYLAETFDRIRPPRDKRDGATEAPS
jgi:hypothetical protein